MRLCLFHDLGCLDSKGLHAGKKNLKEFELSTNQTYSVYPAPRPVSGEFKLKQAIILISYIYTCQANYLERVLHNWTILLMDLNSTGNLLPTSTCKRNLHE